MQTVPAPEHKLSREYIQRYSGQYFDNVLQRLNKGALKYGDSSFVGNTLDSSIEEIQAEIEDICGWGFTLWVRLQIVKENLVERWERKIPL